MQMTLKHNNTTYRFNINARGKKMQITASGFKWLPPKNNWPYPGRSTLIGLL
jgi:hypothetical protein